MFTKIQTDQKKMDRVQLKADEEWWLTLFRETKVTVKKMAKEAAQLKMQEREDCQRELNTLHENRRAEQEEEKGRSREEERRPGCAQACAPPECGRPRILSEHLHGKMELTRCTKILDGKSASPVG